MPGIAPWGERTVLVNAADWPRYGAPDLPDDAVYVNAPRPLNGLATWTGPFRHGIFYAAAPHVAGGPDPFERFGWRADDAWPVVFITDGDIEQLVALKLAEYGYATPEEASCTMAELAASYDLPYRKEAP